MPEPPRLATRVWYLELGEPAPPPPLPATARIERSQTPIGPLNRFFYEAVGRDVQWVDRLGWSDERWQTYAETVETWLLHDRGTPAGYAELRDHGDRIALEFFGLLAPFRGRGLGGAFLARVAERARELGGRVTLQTCELDGPHARANYERRGFRVVRETVEPRGRRT